ncbi:MAG: hypothetical protein HS104_35440 [Polyangiaceae bacterium]|nr:hypothetical protein [Polyangiaceae bacterium]
MLPSRTWTLVLALPVLGCGGSDDATPGEGACADASKVLAFPTPAWQKGEKLSPPAGDFALGMVAEVKPKWAEQLELVDGWPARPTLVLPLDAAASSVDASQLWFFGAKPGEAPADLGTPFSTTLSEDGLTLVVQPRDPVPPGVSDVVLVVGESAVSGARALPACGSTAAYAAAKQSLPSGTDAALALPFRVATTAEDLLHLYEQVAATPVLKVAKVEARPLASFGSAAPPADVAPSLAPTAASGLLELPAYADAAGVIQRGADGVPIATGVTKPGFVVALPAKGSAPFPFVLFQHGGGQNKTDFFQLAKPLAEAGFAFVAIDLPYHGDRAGGAGGSDLDFVDFSDLAKTRDNFRQAVADHQAVFTGIAALNAALEPALSVKDALDASKGFYMGLSLGGISGSMTFATTKNVNAAGLFVAAGGYPEIVSKGLFAALVANIVNRPTPEKETLLGLAEVVLDGADPLAYALRVEDRAARPRPALFMQAIADPVIPEPSSDQWARAFGAGLALPTQHPVAGMAELGLPASDNMSFAPGGEKATRILVQNPMNEIPAAQRHGALIVQAYSQTAVAHCFSTWLAKGSCELIDSGFASH